MSEPGLTNFDLFPFLPVELRRKIYLLCTPARVVEIVTVKLPKRGPTDEYHNLSSDLQDDRDWDEFIEKHSSTPFTTAIHPDLAYFSHNWRCISPQGKSQRTLDDYPGFGSGRQKEHPWEPTAETPEVPLHALGSGNHAKLAYEFSRHVGLSSPAIIPRFLQVCTESRQILQAYGYVLAFGTRTTEPLTWIDFKRDVVYLPIAMSPSALCQPTFDEASGWSNLLCHSKWDLGRFLSQDLKRTRNLALEPEGTFLEDDTAEQTMSSVLRLMPNLENLYLPCMAAEHMFYEFEIFNDVGEQATAKSLGPESLAAPWSMLPAHDIDCLVPEISQYYKGREDGDATTYYEFRERRLLQQLKTELRAIDSKQETRALWKIPRVKYVMLCGRSMVQDLMTSRQYLWNNYIKHGRETWRMKKRGGLEYNDSFESFVEFVLRAEKLPDRTGFIRAARKLSLPTSGWYYWLCTHDVIHDPFKSISYIIY